MSFHIKLTLTKSSICFKSDISSKIIRLPREESELEGRKKEEQESGEERVKRNLHS